MKLGFGMEIINIEDVYFVTIPEYRIAVKGKDLRSAYKKARAELYFLWRDTGLSPEEFAAIASEEKLQLTEMSFDNVLNEITENKLKMVKIQSRMVFETYDMTRDFPEFNNCNLYERELKRIKSDNEYIPRKYIKN